VGWGSVGDGGGSVGTRVGSTVVGSTTVGSAAVGSMISGTGVEVGDGVAGWVGSGTTGGLVSVAAGNGVTSTGRTGFVGVDAGVAINPSAGVGRIGRIKSSERSSITTLANFLDPAAFAAVT